jgi:DNA-binding response OmpR family regulator
MNAYDQAQSLLAKMRSNRGTPAYHTYSDQLEVLMRAYMEPKDGVVWHDLGLNGTQSRFATLLHTSMGRAVTYASIMDALYFDRAAGEEPDQEILKVMVVYIRKKLAKTNFRIETIWGKGYSMVEISDKAKAPTVSFPLMGGRHRPSNRIAA